MSIEKHIFNRYSNYHYETLSSEIVNKIKTILLHDLVIGKWGRNSSYYKMIKGFYEEGDTLSGNLFLESAAMSVQANEDFYGANHFGPLILSNALFFAQKTGATGKEFIAAIAAGFEFASMLVDQLGSKAGENGYRGTPLFGVLGASLTASLLLKNSPKQHLTTLAHAYANSFGVGISLLKGTDEWRYQSALGALHAGLAAHLSSEGLKGYEVPLSGEKGFLDVFTKGEHLILPEKIELNILKVGVKRQPVHIFVLSPVMAALQIVEQTGKLTASEIKKVILTVPAKQLLDLNQQTGPYEEVNQAIVSIPTSVALILLDAVYSAESLIKVNNPAVIDVARKVTIEPNTVITDYQTKIEVQLTIRTHKAVIENPDNLYFTNFIDEYLLLREEVKEWGGSIDDVQALSEEIENLENSDSVEQLIQLYRI